MQLFEFSRTVLCSFPKLTINILESIIINTDRESMLQWQREPLPVWVWVMVLACWWRAHAHVTHIQFLGRDQERSHWRRFQSEVNCWTQHGQWKAHPEWGLQNSSFEALSPCYHHAYAPSQCLNVFSTPTLNYQWELPPNKCLRNSLLPFDHNSICRAMKMSKGNIMIVGDSMNEFFGISVRNLFARYNSSVPCVPACERHCQEHSQRNILPCWDNNDNKDIELFIVRNDHLTLTSVKNINQQLNVYQWPWFDLIEKHNISLLILNRGAHFLASELLIPELNNTLHALQRHPHVSVIWRNTPYGHTLDKVDQAPLTIPQHILDPKFNETAPYHYGEFQPQNEVIRK
jgi:hypothetical protein